MAQHSIGGAGSLRTSTSHTPSLHSVITLRLTCGLVTLFGALISFLGTSWDIQWHAFVGRDRTLIPPHEMMLTGIALGGIATLVAIITETIWVRQHRSIATQFTPFAGLFSGSLGMVQIKVTIERLSGLRGISSSQQPIGFNLERARPL